MRGILILLLLGIPACAHGDDRPSRRAMAEAMINALECIPEGATSCIPPPRRTVLTSLRCTPVGEGERAGQMLCTYSGTRDMGVVSFRFEDECAWLSHLGARHWMIVGYPDADVCEAAA